jgi:5-methylcytosine-specific restriction endonuclease McrA
VSLATNANTTAHKVEVFPPTGKHFGAPQTSALHEQDRRPFVPSRGCLAKGDKPQVLVDNEETWTTEYLAAIPRGEAKRHERWRHRQIREALRDELAGKCAYCEGFVKDVAFPHVEHIIPKGLRPDLAHRWENLTSACPRCNVAKDDFYDEENGLLDPYQDDLDAHLIFLGGLINWGLGSFRGELTVRRLGLNRLDLINARAKRLGEVRQVVDEWHTAEESLKEVLAAGLRIDAHQGEFSATVCAYLRSFGFPL